jgi:hypothetical protein
MRVEFVCHKNDSLYFGAEVEELDLSTVYGIVRAVIREITNSQRV